MVSAVLLVPEEEDRRLGVKHFSQFGTLIILDSEGREVTDG